MHRMNSLLAGLAALVIGAGSAQAATKVTVMFTASAPYMASFVAKDQGFFAKRDLDVDFVLAANGSVIIAAVQAGSAQVGTPSPPVFVQAADSGLDVVAIAATNVYPERTKSGLLARNGVDIKTPQDLVGKKIGVPGIGGILDVLLKKWLTDNGVDLKQINFVEIVLPQTGDALRAGQVDAVASVDPFVSRAIATGAGTFVIDYSSTLPPGTIASVYMTTGAWAKANPAAVKAFQEGLAEAIAFVPTHEAAARESLGRYTKLPPELTATIAIPNLSAPLSTEQIAFWIKLCREQGMIAGAPDPAKLVVPWPKS